MQLTVVVLLQRPYLVCKNVSASVLELQKYTSFFVYLSGHFSCVSPYALLRKSHLCISFLGIARPQSQFPHLCVCERFMYSQDRSTYLLQQNRRINHGNIYSLFAHRHMNVEIGTVAAQFRIWEYLFRIFGIGSLQCVRSTTILQTSPLTFRLYCTLHGVPLMVPVGESNRDHSLLQAIAHTTQLRHKPAFLHFCHYCTYCCTCMPHINFYAPEAHIM